MADEQRSGVEEWRPVVGLESYYTVSSIGRVCSLHSGPSRLGAIRSPQVATNGYLRMAMRGGGTKRREPVHRLVCTAFIPNPLGLPWINHKNGIKTDNRVENLEWCTAKQNAEHAANVLHSYVVGTGQKSSKLSENDVREIRLAHACGESCVSLGRRFGVAKQTAQSIVNRAKWRHVP